MLNLFSLKEKKEEGGKGGGSSKKKASAAQLRITKVMYFEPHKNFHQPWMYQDINELELPKTCKTEFPDPDDLLSFKLVIYPDEVLLVNIASLSFYDIFLILGLLSTWSVHI